MYVKCSRCGSHLSSLECVTEKWLEVEPCKKCLEDAQNGKLRIVEHNNSGTFREAIKVGCVGVSNV